MVSTPPLAQLRLRGGPPPTATQRDPAAAPAHATSAARSPRVPPHLARALLRHRRRRERRATRSNLQRLTGRAHRRHHLDLEFHSHTAFIFDANLPKNGAGSSRAHAAREVTAIAPSFLSLFLFFSCIKNTAFASQLQVQAIYLEGTLQQKKRKQIEKKNFTAKGCRCPRAFSFLNRQGILSSQPSWAGD
jgi:hypothetical protein